MKFSDDKMLRIIAYYNVIVQIISVLRATAIYNTSYIANMMRAVISLLFFFTFCVRFKAKQIKMDIYDIIFIGIPITAMGYGIVFNGFGRDFISDLYNALAFGMIIIYYKGHPDAVSKKNLREVALIEMWGTTLSLLIYVLFDRIGIEVYSVGRVSNFLLFPMAVFLAYGEKKWLYVLLLVILGGKRGVLLSALAMIAFFYLIKKQQRIKKVIMISLIMMVGYGMIFFTMSPGRVALLPGSVQGMAYRFMKVNPFSEYRDWYSGGRLDEVLGALREFKEDEWTLMIGKGNGFLYTLTERGKVTDPSRHNVHFTPVSFLTRYGLFYMLVFYVSVFQILIKGVHYVKHGKNYALIMSLLLFFFATFVDSFTAFLPYSEYQFMVCFGALSGIFRKGMVFVDEGNQQKDQFKEI